MVSTLHERSGDTMVYTAAFQRLLGVYEGWLHVDGWKIRLRKVGEATMDREGNDKLREA